jgi:archaellum component FlaC
MSLSDTYTDSPTGKATLAMAYQLKAKDEEIAALKLEVNTGKSIIQNQIDIVDGFKEQDERLRMKLSEAESKINALESETTENYQIHTRAIAILRGEVARLQGICREIEEHEHCNSGCYEIDAGSKELDPVLNIGTYHGHRCAAAIAGKWRVK